MIISHSRKFIFLKTRKTAGTSLEIALSRYCGPGDILTPINYDEEARTAVSSLKAQNYAKPISKYRLSELVRRIARGEKPAVYTEHMMAVDARRRIGEAIWREYFKFTIVRNPFDRMLSRFHWTMKMRPRYSDVWGVETLNDFIRHRADFVNENWLIYTAGDALLVDDVVLFERLEADLGRISARIGLDHNLHDDMKAITAKAGFRPGKAGRKDLIAPEDAAIIAGLCRKEIEAFDYAWPGPWRDAARSLPQVEGVSS